MRPHPLEFHSECARIPWSSILNAHDVPGEDGNEPQQQLACNTVRKLIREMELGDESSYAPYVQFLAELGDEPPFIPSSWSDAGKALLEMALHRPTHFSALLPIEPTEWLSQDWERVCGGGRSHAEDLAALLVITRSESGNLVPWLDMYNHDDGAGYRLYASRPIQAGEQLFISYTQCSNCDRPEYYGMPEIFRDYGFVEGFPQRWTFYYGIHSRAFFDIDQAEHGDASAQREAIWHDGEDDAAIHDALHNHLRRFRQFRYDQLSGTPQDVVLRNVNGVSNLQFDDTSTPSQQEFDAVVKYVDAAIAALETALSSVKYADANRNHSHELCLGQASSHGDADAHPVDKNACIFDTLTTSPDPLVYSFQTYDVQQMLTFEDYEVLEHVQSEYQGLLFQRQLSSPENVFDEDDDEDATDDKIDAKICMRLDGSVARPRHEPEG